MGADWDKELKRWLEPFVEALGHRTRRRMCPTAYVAGLIGPGDRKSVQPMAARDSGVSYDQLHHFIGSGVWDAAPLEAALLIEADKLVGSDDALVDHRRHRVAGRRASLGWRCANISPPRLGRLPTVSSLVSVTLASREVPVIVGLRLFLPETWTGRDPKRMTRARVPKDRQTALTKPEIAIEEIDRVSRCSGARFGCVLADAGYGSSVAFSARR